MTNIAIPNQCNNDDDNEHSQYQEEGDDVVDDDDDDHHHHHGHEHVEYKADKWKSTRKHRSRPGKKNKASADNAGGDDDDDYVDGNSNREAR